MKNILLLSFYFPPYKGVGSKRADYWYKKMCNDKRFDITVLTAIPQTKKKKNIYYVPTSKYKSILNLFIKDEGVLWTKNVKKWFQKQNLKYDTLIITGGPFMHMVLSRFFKINGIKKIILDFRDPFYNNPRFNSSKIKNLIKLYFQKKFIKSADFVISVNSYCGNLLNSEKVKIIENGFDDSVNNLLTESSLKNDVLISVGKVYDDFNLNTFNSFVKNSEFKFSYYGESHSKIISCNNVFLSNSIPYDILLEKILYSEICILFTGGKPFESTTKIFDYLRFNKKILIVTEGDIKTGALFDITKNNPNVYWSINSKFQIELMINKIISNRVIDFDTSIYSRKYTYNKLVEIL